MQHEEQARGARNLGPVQNYDITGISKTSWEESCGWGVNEGWLQTLHKRLAGQVRRGGGAVYNGEAGLYGACSWQ